MDIIIVDDEAEIDGKLPRLLELRSHVGTAPIEEKPSTSVGGNATRAEAQELQTTQS